MGNRAIIKAEGSNIGVYLHWNGGINSVTAFLKYCEMKGYRPFEDAYGIARFIQIVGNYFGGNCSIGILENNIQENEDCASWYDNGIYIVKGWKIVKRLSPSVEHEGYDLTEMLCAIDKEQPINERLTEGYIKAEIIPAEQLNIGDRVYIQDFEERVGIQTVIGFGSEGKWLNGFDVSGVPYVDKYGENKADNINNYLFGDIRKVSI